MPSLLNPQGLKKLKIKLKTKNKITQNPSLKRKNLKEKRSPSQARHIIATPIK